MVFFIILLLLVISNGMSFCQAGCFNDSYLDKKNTTAVNGIFVILIVFSHYSQYTDFGGVYDDPYLILKSHISQMVVASFLFYSGYGMMEAIRRRGDKYIKKILSKFWQLLLKFDLAVMLYLILDLLLGIRYPVSRILISLTGWESIGNSNWYIFDILIIYLLMYVGFKLAYVLPERFRNIAGTILLFILTGAFIAALIMTGKDTWWYNTIILLPTGCLYSVCRSHIEKLVMRSDISYAIAVMLTIGIYILSLFRRNSGLIMYSVWALSFIAVILLLTMKAVIYNPVLEWFGTHVFSIYILQRISMITMYKLGFIADHKYMCLISAFAVTIPLALIFEALTARLIDRISGLQAKASG